MKKLIILFIFISSVAFAQMPPPGTMPPMGMGKGRIVGMLYSVDKAGKKTPLVDYPVGIMVFQNGQRMLTLDKKTGTKGEFTFKNIKQEDGFTYVLGVIENEKLYVMSDIALKPSEDVFKADFRVGEGSPYLMEDVDLHAAQAGDVAPEGAPPAMSGQMGSGTSSKSALSVEKVLGHPHQKLAVLLGVLVLAMGFYFYNREENQ